MTLANMYQLKKLFRYLKLLSTEDTDYSAEQLKDIIFQVALELEEIHTKEDLPWIE